MGSVAVIDAPEAKYLMGGGSYASLWIIFSLLGLMAGVGMAVLELLMRPTLVNLKDVEDVLGLETLGNVPKDDGYFQKNTQLLSEKHRSGCRSCAELCLGGIYPDQSLRHEGKAAPILCGPLPRTARARARWQRTWLCSFRIWKSALCCWT